MTPENKHSRAMRVPIQELLTGLFIAFLAVLSPGSASSQTMDGSFFSELVFGGGSNGLDRFTTTVHLKPTSNIPIGTSTLMFNYNSTGLTLPSGATGNEVLQRGIDYDFLAPFDSLSSGGRYNHSTVTLFGNTGRISINLVLDSTAQGGVLSSSGTSVARFYFDVLSDVETSQLSWIHATLPNGTVFQFDDNIITVPYGALVDRNDLLDVQLPVELATFESTSDRQRAVLDWSTVRETNLSAFEVQHFSLVAEDWETQDIVEPSRAVVDESGERRYKHETESLDFGLHRFRLRAISSDGVDSFSDETEVQINLDVPFEISPIYPNPASNRATLPMAVREPQQVTVTAIDVLGRSVRVLHDAALTANETHRLLLRIDGLAAGTYFLLVKGETIRATSRIAIVR